MRTPDRPRNFSRVVDRKRYDTETATLIADDQYWDGHNFERRGRNTFLFRTPKGAYFTVSTSLWQGERDTLEPVTLEESMELFEKELPEHAVSFAEAFPGVKVDDA